MAIPPLGVTDAQANAIEATAKLGVTVVQAGSDLAHYVSRIIGTVPDDVIGLTIGEHLRALRTLAAGWYDIKVGEILDRRRARRQPVSLSLALPLMQGAYDESREGLRDLWAALMAAAMDPDRAERVRISFVDTLKRFDRLDALILRERQNAQGDLKPNSAEFLAAKLGIVVEEVMISAETLCNLRCAMFATTLASFFITAYGRGLLRAVSD
jgi:hypothetical protein